MKRYKSKTELKLKPNSVIVAHPGTQHSHHTAHGLLKADLLKLYLTGFFYQETWLEKKLKQYFGAEILNKIQSNLYRRKRADLPREKVRSFPFFEILKILTARSNWTSKFSPLFSSIHRTMFPFFTNHFLKICKPQIFIGYESVAYEMFLKCQQLGICKILDHTTGSVFAAKEIYSEEAKKYPEFFKSRQFQKTNTYYQRHQMEMDLADAILVSSDYAMENIIKIGISPQKLFKLPYGAEVSKFNLLKEPIDDGVTRVVYAGNISGHKGIHYLIEAFRKLDPRRFKLKMAGFNLLTQEIVNTLPENIEIMPFLNQDDLRQLYKIADIFAFPAIHEGSSLSIYEAMAAGLTVITTPNAGSVIENMKDGIIIQPFDSNLLADKINYLADSKALMSYISKNAREKAKLYTWGKYYDRLKETIINIYER